MERNYTIEEASEVLRTPVGTLRKHRKEIGFSKLGRRLVFREKDLLRWMESRREKPVHELQEAV